MIGISSSNVGYSRSVVDAKIAAVSGIATNISGVVYTTGDQVINGVKTFSSSEIFNSGIFVSGSSVFYNNLSISGHLSAATKAFKIKHPTKSDKMLVHGASEAPEWSVFVRGKTDEPIIPLPDYWLGLVHKDSVSCLLTPISKPMSLYVVEQNNERVVIGGLEAGGSYNYVVYGERKDVEKLVPEV